VPDAAHRPVIRYRSPWLIYLAWRRGHDRYLSRCIEPFRELIDLRTSHSKQEDTMVQVVGSNDTGDGVQGFSNSNTHSGVVGQNNSGGFGVLGEANGPNSAVAGVNLGVGPGITGRSDGPNSAGDGVQGFASSTSRSGVVGTHNFGGVGVLGQANGPNAAVAGVNTGTGAGIFGKGGGLAGQFEGNVDITGKLGVKDIVPRGSSEVLVNGVLGVTLDLGVNGTVNVLGDVRVLGAGAAGLRDIAARVQSLETRLNTLQTQLNNLQAQLGNLQQKENSDVQGIAQSLVTLAARVTALGG
jgi:hypothetical protein